MAANQRDTELDKLKEMFPKIEDDVIMMILEETHRDFNSAADILICMAGEEDEPISDLPEEVDSGGLPEIAREASVHGNFGNSLQASNKQFQELNHNPKPTREDSMKAVEEQYIQLSGHVDRQNLFPTLTSEKESDAKESSESGIAISQQFSQMSLYSQVALKSRSPSRSNQVKQEKKPEKDLVQDLKSFGLPELVDDFSSGVKILLIMRGPPGSGKSTLAQKYIAGLGTGKIFSTDDYFMKNNRYVFSPHELSDAHSATQSKVKRALLEGERLVIVDNTNTMSWEIRPYIAMGAEFKYRMYLQEAINYASLNAKTLAKKNIHNVPKDKIELMIARYEKGLTVELLADRYNISLPVFSELSRCNEPEGIGDEKIETDTSTDADPDQVTASQEFGKTDDISSDIGDDIDTGLKEHTPKTNVEVENSLMKTDNEIATGDIVVDSKDDDEIYESDSDEQESFAEFSNHITVKEAIPGIVTVDTDTQHTKLTGVIEADECVEVPDVRLTPDNAQESINLFSAFTKETSTGGGNIQEHPEHSFGSLLYRGTSPSVSPRPTFRAEANDNVWQPQEAVLKSWEQPPPSSPRQNKDKKDPKPQRKSRSQRSKKIDITKGVYEELHQKEQELRLDSALIAATVACSQQQDSIQLPLSEGPDPPNFPFAMDPLLAVKLQEAFGPPLDESVLQVLDTEEILSNVKIPESLARQVFECWRSSLIEYMSTRDELKAKPGLDLASEKEFPRVVMAPEAAERYENMLVNKAIAESKKASPKRPIIVAKSRSAERISTVKIEDEDEEVDMYRRKRDQLYRKAMDAKSRKIGGAAAFYASEARQQNKIFKEKIQEKQENMFKAANEAIGNRNTIDLHYLTTGTAIKHLHSFLHDREEALGLVKSGTVTVEVITGRGLNSDNGRSRIRPAVTSWLQQKGYKFSEPNSGSLTVYLPRET